MKKIVLMAILSSMLIILSAMPLWDKPVPIRTGDNIEWSRCGAVTADGSMIYVWSGTSRGDGDIYAQKVNGNGVVVWDEPLLVDGKSFKQSFPVITKTTDNNFIIAWLDYGEDFKSIIKAQKITANGQILWVDGGVPVRSIPQDKMDFEIIADNNNGAYIAWIDKRDSYKVYGQHLDAYGNSLWTLDGIPLAPISDDIVNFSMATDTSGALVVAHFKVVNYVYSLIVNKILSNGQFAWSQPLQIADNNHNGNYVQVAAINDSAVVVTWVSQTISSYLGDQVLAQRVNHDGTLGWLSPAPAHTVSVDNPYSTRNPRIIKAIDNAVIISWVDYRANYDYGNIYLQRIDANGNVQWNPAGVPAALTDYAQSNPRLTSNNNGGCFVTWEDYRNDGYFNTDIYAQHISMLGDKMWNPSGLPVCNASLAQTAPMVRQIGNNVLFGWKDERNGSPSLYYNVINRLGVPQVASDGVCLHQGLAGKEYFYDYLSLPRSNDVALLWTESRGSLGNRIYLQFLNPDGSVDLEANGRPITDSLSEDNYLDRMDAIVTPDDYIAVTWVENTRVKAQLIDNNGNRLWGNNGLTLTDTEPIRQEYPKVSYENGAFYFGWSELQEIQTNMGMMHLYRIYGQKIVNNEKQWGPGGILISDTLPNDTDYEANLRQVKGRYFVWTKVNFNLNDDWLQCIQVKLVNPDGTTAPGWDNAGNSVSSNTSSYIAHDRSQCIQTSAGLVVAWLNFNDLGTFLYGQLLSESGALSWNPEGILLTGENLSIDSFTLCESNNNLIVAWVKQQNQDRSYIKAQKFDLSANPLWGENGILVSDNLPNTHASEAYPITFSNSGILFCWVQCIVEPYIYDYQYDICYRYLNPDGSWVSNSLASLVIMSPDSQYSPRLALVNNEVIVTWIDSDLFFEHNRCDEEIWEYYNLFAQKLSNEVVGNIDDVTPIPQIYLKQNYPNPFNPETNISFSLKQTSEIELCIYNLKGQMVKTLQKGLMDKGNHSLVWKGTDDNDKPVASGVYLYRLSSGKAQTSRKMVLLK
jgi:hypothetical protein